MLSSFFSLFALLPSPDELARVGDRDKMVMTLIKLRNTEEENVIKEADLITKNTEDMKKEVKRSHINKIKEMDKAQIKNCGILLIVISFSHLSGIFAVSAFLLDIFSSTDISSVVLVLVSSFSEMVFSFVQMAVADRLGR
jgi:hypothetical protein